MTWELILSKIESTPGLKNVGQHLLLSTLEDTRLVLTIADSGRDSMNYILAQCQRIEQLLANEFGKKIAVVIEAGDLPKRMPASSQTFDAVEKDELVQMARGLFEGTIVNVRNVSEDNQ